MTVITDAEIESFLEHHGVKGMKWGVRRGRGKTGMSRHRGAATDRNLRTISTINKVKAGKKYRISGKLLKAYMGNEKFQRTLNTKIKDLHAQNARIKKGKITIEDRVDMYRTIPMVDLVVSRRPGD